MIEKCNCWAAVTQSTFGQFILLQSRTEFCVFRIYKNSYLCTSDILFLQITTIIKVRMAFVFVLHTLYWIDFSEIYYQRVWSQKTTATQTFMNIVIWQKSISNHHCWRKNFPKLFLPRYSLLRRLNLHSFFSFFLKNQILCWKWSIKFL